jgi:hypothetical protein
LRAPWAYRVRLTDSDPDLPSKIIRTELGLIVTLNTVFLAVGVLFLVPSKHKIASKQPYPVDMIRLESEPFHESQIRVDKAYSTARYQAGRPISTH